MQELLKNNQKGQEVLDLKQIIENIEHENERLIQEKNFLEYTFQGEVSVN